MEPKILAHVVLSPESQKTLASLLRTNSVAVLVDLPTRRLKIFASVDRPSLLIKITNPPDLIWFYLVCTDIARKLEELHLYVRTASWIEFVKNSPKKLSYMRNQPDDHDLLASSSDLISFIMKSRDNFPVALPYVLIFKIYAINNLFNPANIFHDLYIGLTDLAKMNDTHPNIRAAIEYTFSSNRFKEAVRISKLSLGDLWTAPLTESNLEQLKVYREQEEEARALGKRTNLYTNDPRDISLDRQKNPFIKPILEETNIKEDVMEDNPVNPPEVIQPEPADQTHITCIDGWYNTESEKGPPARPPPKSMRYFKTIEGIPGFYLPAESQSLLEFLTKCVSNSNMPMIVYFDNLAKASQRIAEYAANIQHLFHYVTLVDMVFRISDFHIPKNKSWICPLKEKDCDSKYCYLHHREISDCRIAVLATLLDILKAARSRPNSLNYLLENFSSCCRQAKEYIFQNPDEAFMFHSMLDVQENYLHMLKAFQSYSDVNPLILQVVFRTIDFPIFTLSCEMMESSKPFDIPLFYRLYITMMPIKNKELFLREVITSMSYSLQSHSKHFSEFQYKQLIKLLVDTLASSDKEKISHYCQVVCTKDCIPAVKNMCLDTIFQSITESKGSLIVEVFKYISSAFLKDSSTVFPPEFIDFLQKEYLASIDKLFIDVLIEKRQMSTLKQILIFIQNGKTPALTKTIIKFKNSFDNFVSDLSKGYVAITTLKAIYSRPGQVVRLAEDISSLLENNQDTKPKYDSLKNGLVQALSIMGQVDSLSNILHTIISSTSPIYSRLSPETFRDQLKAMTNSDSLNTQTISEVISCLSEYQYIQNSVTLSELPLYFHTLLDSLPKNPCEPSQFNNACKKSEEKVEAFFTKVYKNMNKEDYQRLVDNQEYLTSQTQSLVKLRILGGLKQRDIILRNMSLMIMAQNYKLIHKSLNAINSYLTTNKKIKANSDLGILQLVWDLSEELESKGTLSFEASLSYSAKDEALIKFLSQDISLCGDLEDCLTLMDHFASKEPRHFDDLILDRESSFGIEIDDINSIRNLIDIYKSVPKFKSIEIFFELIVKSKEKIKLKFLKEKSTKLIECSVDLSKDKSDGKVSAENILQDSSILFSFDSNTSNYTVASLLKCDMDKAITTYQKLMAQKAEVSQSTGKKQRLPLVEFDRMKDTKLKIGLYKVSNNKQAQTDESNLFYKKIMAFAAIMEGVEGIIKSLTYLSKTGSVFNLASLIHEKLLAMENVKMDERDAGISDIENVSKTSGLFKVKDFDMVIKTRPHFCTANEHYVEHFRILNTILDELSKEFEESFYTSKIKHHQLTLLEGQQKISICRYFTNPKPPIDSAEVESLLQYMTDSRASILKNIDRKNLKFSLEMQTDAILEKILASCPNKSQMDSSTVQLSLTSKIHFYGYGSNSKFLDLFRILSTKGIATINRFQIFFGTPITRVEEMKVFLLRSLKDPQGRYYFMIDLHLLTNEMSGELQRLCSRFFKRIDSLTNMNLMLIMDKERNSSPLFHDLLKGSHLFEIYSLSKSIDKLNPESIKALRSQIKAVVVTSMKSGMGKSTYIKNEIDRLGAKCLTILLAGDPSQQGIEQRLNILKEACTGSGDQKFAIHIKLDMMDNMENSCELIDQLLFKLCFLKCLPYKGGYLYFENNTQVYIEVQNSYKELLLQRVSILGLINKEELRPLSSTTDLGRRIDINEWPDGESMLTTLIAFWNGIKTQRLGKETLTTLASIENVGNLSHDEIGRYLSEIFLGKGSNNKPKGRTLSKGTLSQLEMLVKILSSQAQEMEEVSGLNPQIMDGPSSSNCSACRLFTAESICEFAADMVWSVADAIRQETHMAVEIIADVKSGNLASNFQMEEYKNTVRCIPKWGAADRVSFFFNQGAMKVIYKTASSVNSDIRNLIKEVTNQDVLDISEVSKSNKDSPIVVQLIEALDLVRILNQEANPKPGESLEKVVESMVMQSISNFSGNGYVLTHDNYIKILMIVQRAILNIPIVIMGATGCGKTFMINFIAECLLRDVFECVTLHAGVTEDQLTESLLAILAKAKITNKRVWVLFDEFNTSPLQCIISEIMINRKSSFCSQLKDVIFPKEVVFVAACNPYRIEANITTVGLVHESSVSMLSHRVYPIPDSMINYIWDFGQLSSETEEKYIFNMLKKKVRKFPKIP